jgi:hypothetical protein
MKDVKTKVYHKNYFEWKIKHEISIQKDFLEE